MPGREEDEREEDDAAEELETSSALAASTPYFQEFHVTFRDESLGVVLLGLSMADARLATPSASRAAGSRRRSKAAPCQPAVSLSRDTSFLRSAAAGGAAACVATVTFHPVDTVKTMLQQHGSSAAGLRRSQLSAREVHPANLTPCIRYSTAVQEP